MATGMVTATRTDCEHSEAGRDSEGVPPRPFCRVPVGSEPTYPDLDHPIVRKPGAQMVPSLVRHDGLLVGRPAIRVRMTTLPAAHRTAISGIPATTAARTVADLARTTPFRSGIVTADSALHRPTCRCGSAATGASWPGRLPVARARHDRRSRWRSSTPIPTGPASSYAATPACVMLGSRLSISAGPS